MTGSIQTSDPHIIGPDDHSLKLATVTPSDYGWVDRAVGGWACSLRWSLHGMTPSPQHLSRLLWQDVPLQQAVWTGGGDPAGLFQLVNVGLCDGVGHLDLLVDATHDAELESALFEFIERIFRDFPLRKLALEAVEDELDVSALLRGRARCIGRLTEHVRRGEHTYADVILFEIWR